MLDISMDFVHHNYRTRRSVDGAGLARAGGGHWSPTNSFPIEWGKSHHIW